MGKFKYKESIALDYDRQKKIYELSRQYRQLPLDQREQIDRLCREVGGEYEQALKEFVTTQRGAKTICRKYFLSRSTLLRIVRRYYMRFPLKP